MARGNCNQCNQIIRRDDVVLYDLRNGGFVHMVCPKLRIVWRNPDPERTPERAALEVA